MNSNPALESDLRAARGYIVELEAEQQELVYDCRDHRIAKDKALAQLAELREAALLKISTEKDCWAANSNSVLFAAQARDVKAHNKLEALLQEKGA